MNFFTSDTHFGHYNSKNGNGIIKYCKRPFQSIEEMDEAIIANWNSCVSDSDTVYHLGDFAFREPGQYRKRMKGKIVLIQGNHDYKRLKSCRNLFENIHDTLYVKVEEVSIFLCHFAMRVWHKSHFNSWHLYGHSHGTLDDYGKSYDVGVDSNNFTPVSFLQLRQIMNSKPDNVNWLKRLRGYDEKEFQETKIIDENDRTGEEIE
jgi:calcineurin-like phosphoesterase family protein